MEFNTAEHPHIRYNPLKGEWVLVSPHRLQRPWQGQQEEIPAEVPEFDPKNPLCPGVTRANGELTPLYESTYVFTNDFPALLPHVPSPPESNDPLFKIADARGTCLVMCFNPKSNVTVGTMEISSLVDVIGRWIQELIRLGEKYLWVQIFENRGAMMGCSNPHPHCQIWATKFLPNEPRIKDLYQLEYYDKTGRPLLMDYLRKELDLKVRIVFQNDSWVVLVPFWAVWPYETMILPLTHVRRMYDLTQTQITDLADAMKRLSTRYDNMFKVTFPYSMGWHGAPTGEMKNEPMDHWVFHGIYYPPLVRSATVKKFMVGYEMLAQSQRDITPEKAAEVLRNLSESHFYLELKMQKEKSTDKKKRTGTSEKTPKSNAGDKGQKMADTKSKQNLKSVK